MGSLFDTQFSFGTPLSAQSEVALLNREFSDLGIPVSFRMEEIIRPLPADVEIALAGTGYQEFILHMKVDGMESPIAKGTMYFVVEKLRYRALYITLAHMTRDRTKAESLR